jgi:opacity protein-like surface antigen
MKTKTFIVVMLLITFITTASSQEQNSYIKNRWNIKLGYGRYSTGTTVSSSGSNAAVKQGNSFLEANYGLLNNFEVGIHTGYSAYKNYELLPSGATELKTYHVLFSGINTNFHILPFFVKSNDFRFDFYLNGKFGGHFSKINALYYSAGAGLSFYPTQHLGLYCEYNYVNVFRASFLRYGIAVKF